jgi:hypothetical protein
MIFRKRERARVLRPFQINPWSPGYHIVLQCTSGSKQSETIGADWVIEKGSIRVGIPRSYRCPWDRRSAGRSSRPPRLPRCRRNIAGYGVMAVQGITAAEKPPARVISTSVQSHQHLRGRRLPHHCRHGDRQGSPAPCVLPPGRPTGPTRICRSAARRPPPPAS